MFQMMNYVHVSSIIKQGWLYASELYHFVQFLSKARTRNVEALYCPESAILYQTEDWRKLKGQLHHSKVMGKFVIKAKVYTRKTHFFSSLRGV